MKEREEIIQYCNTYQQVYHDAPFHDSNWILMRHKANKKAFACIYEREGHIWLNLKCGPELKEIWRSAYQSVIPAYHMNKEHWNSVILDDSIPEEQVKQMIDESYELTRPKKRQK